MNSHTSKRGSPDLAHVRSLLGTLDAHGIALAAELLDAIQSAANILRLIADDPTPAGREAAIAFQILEDAAASAAPPPAVTATTSPES